MKNKETYRAVVPGRKLIPRPLFEKIQKAIPIVCVDLVFVRKIRNQPETLLFKRKIYPGRGKWCIIGGRVLKGERLKQAIERHAERELGAKFDFLGHWNPNNPVLVFDNPNGDPQKHPITLSYPLLLKSSHYRQSGPEFSEAEWFPINRLPAKIGFFHREEINKVFKVLVKSGAI